jgi:tetratricopeptide (TPR) repeat protein
MPETGSTNSPLPFEGFLTILTSRGFKAGIDQRARLLRLLDQPGMEASERLKTLLCPVFASNDAQQQEFYNLFDEYFPELSRLEQHDKIPVVPLTRGPRRLRPHSALIVALNVGWIGVLAYTGWRLLPRRVRPPESTLVEPRTRNNSEDSEAFTAGPFVLPKKSNQTAPKVPLPKIIAVIAPYLLVVSLLFWELISYLRREAILSRTPRNQPPAKWPLSPGPHPFRSPPNPTVRRIARRFAARRPGDSVQVDLPGTIAATVRALGFLRLAFRAVRERPEYLILIERQSLQDHLAALFRERMASLEREGMLMAVFFYDRVPQVCTGALDQEAIHLDALRSRFGAWKLLIFGNGSEFANPYVPEPSRTLAALSSFEHKVLFSPVPPGERTSSERRLESFLPVLPSTEEGLLSVAEYWSGGARIHPDPLPNAPASPPRWDELRWQELLPQYVQALRLYLGQALYRWLCACSLHTRLECELTFALGTREVLENHTVTEPEVLRLFRLEWFRKGLMPPPLRELLVRDLDPATAKNARSLILEYLRSSPAPAGSFAETVQKSEIAGQEWALQPAEQQRVLENREWMQLLAAMGAPKLSRIIPKRIRRWSFSNSLPTFGLAPGLRAVVAVSSAVLVLAGTEIAGLLPPIREVHQYVDVFRKRPNLSPSRCDNEAPGRSHPPRFRTASGYLESGMAYFADLNYDCAMTAFSNVITLDPRHAEAYSKRAACVLGLGLVGKDLERARADLETALRLDPTNPRAIYNMNVLLSRLGDFNSAIEYTRKSLSLNPNDAANHNGLGVVYDALHRFDDAIREYSEAIRLDRNFEYPYNNRGYVYQEQGDLNKALADYRKAVELNPTFALPACSIGQILLRQGKYEEAIVEFRKAIQNNPRYRPSYKTLWGALEDHEEHLKAVEVMNQLLAVSADADAYLYRGMAYDRMGENSLAALSDYNKAVELRPQWVLALRHRGMLYVALGHEDKAKADFGRILDLPADEESKKIARQYLEK